MMAKHTPGPWRVEEFDESQTCIVAGNQIIANCFQDDGLRQANARLIATAPEQAKRIAALEDALRTIYEYQKIGPAFYRIPGMDGWHITPFTHTQIERVRHECCKVARAALAGGEGQGDG